MIWRGNDARPQMLYCDIGPYAGQYRLTGYVYGTQDELEALLASRKNELAVVPDVPEPEREPVPDWWEPYAGYFPDWHVWAGVGDLLYARRPKSSPPKVVRGKTAVELCDAIRQAERGADDGEDQRLRSA